MDLTRDELLKLIEEWSEGPLVSHTRDRRIGPLASFRTDAQSTDGLCRKVAI